MKGEGLLAFKATVAMLQYLLLFSHLQNIFAKQWYRVIISEKVKKSEGQIVTIVRPITLATKKLEDVFARTKQSDLLV